MKKNPFLDVTLILLVTLILDGFSANSDSETRPSTISSLNQSLCQQSCNSNGLCDENTGTCICTTKGIIGENCDKCDRVNNYFGDATKGPCYYDLAQDYQFTFSLIREKDKHIRRINFKNTPTKADLDVDFNVTCTEPAKLNITVQYNLGYGVLEQQLASEQNCTFYKDRFSRNDFVFGQVSNTTFYVDVYDFKTPMRIVISFSQHPKLDLLQLFISIVTIVGYIVGAQATIYILFLVIFYFKNKVM